MIKFDFSECKIDKKYLSKKEEVLEKFKNSYMTGWVKRIDNQVVSDIINTANSVKTYSDCLVVVGIGGSFLGSYAVSRALNKYFGSNNFEVIYAGTTLSSEYIEELLEYLKDKDFSINVISKSGTTMETTITYSLLKDLMRKKYSKEEMKRRIILTTDPVKGKLREEALIEGYKTFPIPDDIGGRYSIITAAHLFPLAFNYNINELIEGFYEGVKLENDAYTYASTRKSLYDLGKYVENYVVYEEKLDAFSEWLKQLFGESEGKENKGILPTSTVHTRDLHSLGQFVQEGHKILFETFIKVDNSNKVTYGNRDLHEINNIVLESVRVAHRSGDVESIMITLPEISLRYLGKVMYFFMLSAAYAGLLFDIDPFNQPGVEVYKKQVRENLQDE